MTKINKIIYFDKETIQNILQEQNNGDLHTKRETTNSSKEKARAEAEANVKLKIGVPLLGRIKFLFTGKLEASLIRNVNNVTTLSSTEISEFEKIKDDLTRFKNRQVWDVKNFSTSFKTAAVYLRMVNGNIEDLENVDVQKFESIFSTFDGYDLYKISDSEYVRFNNEAFVSNYKRNELLLTKLDLYCIPVGVFDKLDFDYSEQLMNMKQILVPIDGPKYLNDIYGKPSNSKSLNTESDKKDSIQLFDVLYASVNVKDKGDKQN